MNVFEATAESNGSKIICTTIITISIGVFFFSILMLVALGNKWHLRKRENAQNKIWGVELEKDGSASMVVERCVGREEDGGTVTATTKIG